MITRRNTLCTLEGMLNSQDLEEHLAGYVSICCVLRDIVNHLGQDLDDENRINKKKYINI